MNSSYQSYRGSNPPKPVGLIATGINWGIRINWGFPANTEDTLKTEIQYTANSDFSEPLLLADIPYPLTEYTQLGLRAGQEFWYRAQLVDRTGNESGYTDFLVSLLTPTPEIPLDLLQ